MLIGIAAISDLFGDSFAVEDGELDELQKWKRMMCKQDNHTNVATSTDLDDVGPGSNSQIKSLPTTQTASLEKLTQPTRSQTFETYSRDDEL